MLRFSPAILLLVYIAAPAACAAAVPQSQSPADFSQLSIEELGNIEITSVSRKKEALSDAAAAVFVISGEDIRRSGATSLPEALRLAPNLQIARVDANQYAITARGFNSTTANKLQVLIDGRSVYTPLFSGVFWDVQDVLLEDVERIEVISGPGGTLWGSNAVKVHDIVWGGGYRRMQDQVDNTAVLAFLPANRSLSLVNLFAQDSIALHPRLTLTLGAKLEHNSYTGTEFQPNVRLAWKLNDRALLWSSISRAVRTPSRIDAEFFIPGTAPFLLVGNPDFQSEKLTAYELGYRTEPGSNVSFSIATFYNVYDELRSVEPASGGGFPFVLANKLQGNTYGVEMWGNYRVNDWWRLSAGYNYLKKDLSLQSGSRDTTSLSGADTDPRHQFSLRSAMNLPHNVELDVALRSLSGFGSSSSKVPHYTALDARIGWLVAKGVELSLTGVNLLDPQHPEFGSVSSRSELDRSVYLKMLWSF